MKVKVIKKFRDKLNPKKVFTTGEVIDTFDDLRVRDLAMRGLVQVVQSASPKGTKSAE